MNKKPLGEVEPSATLDGEQRTHAPGGVMIFSSSLPRFKAFLGQAAEGCADWPCCVLFVTCCLLPAARRSVTAASRAVRSDLRNAGYLLRFLGGSRSPACLLAAAQQRLLDDSAQHSARLHVLVVDSTQHGQQGQYTENTFAQGNYHSRPKKSSRKQKKVHRRSSHGFVFALLLSPAGLRIPYWLPFYTKDYCQLRGWRHRTQADLAAQLITELPVADCIPVVVVGDTAFDAKQIRKACAARNYQGIVPVNPERRLAGDKPRPQVRSLFGQLGAQDFQRVSFRLDQGELAPLARVSPSRSRSSNHQRTYWVHQRTATVLSVGEVTLLFSMKHEPDAAGKVVVQKVLMSNAVAASATALLHCYALRWQIEQFFKEMKSELGMCQYKLGRFERVVGWVNLAVLAFCYLEWYRHQQQRRAAAKEQPYWQAARTHGLREKLRQEVEKADIQELIRLAGGPGGKKRLKDLLKAGYDDPAGPKRRQGHQ